MLVTNLTANCYILSRVTILLPDAADVEVSDSLYQEDSTLNAQIDALLGRGLISITGKPSDPFPSRGQTIAANDGDTTPMVLEAAEGQAVDLFQVYDELARLRFQITPDGNLTVYDRFTFPTLETASDGSWGANHNGFYVAGDPTAPGFAGFEVDDQDFNTGFVATLSGIQMQQRHERPGLPTVRVIPLASGSERVMEVYDRSGAVTFAIDADGTVHVKTGGSVHADL
jgi:hypothetical protein